MRSGFSLVEVLVALVVLEVATLGALGIVVIAARTMNEAEVVERAVWALEGTADSLSLFAVPGEGSKQLPEGWIRWTVATGGGFTVSFERDGHAPLQVAGVARSAGS